jgi:hypothetical protein
MKRTFYKEGDRYIMATGECPPAFKGIMFVVWEGKLGALKEGVKTLDQLKKLEEVDEIPEKWLDAFAGAAKLDLDSHKPKPEAKHTRAAPSKRDTPLDEFVGHCAAGTDSITAAVVSELFDEPPEELGTLTPEGQFVHNVMVVFSLLGGTALMLWWVMSCL